MIQLIMANCSQIEADTGDGQISRPGFQKASSSGVCNSSTSQQAKEARMGNHRNGERDDRVRARLQSGIPRSQMVKEVRNGGER